jgi:hypothetical protein
MGTLFCFEGYKCTRKNPTHPPPPHIEGVVASVYKHCSIAANPIFKKQDRNTAIWIPHPLKILKNSQEAMSNVGQHCIKKCPEPFDSGQKMATETIKEKQ